MSMENLRKGAQSITSGKGKGGRAAFFVQWRPPQISVGAGMGKSRVTFDLKPYLAAPPSEESKVEAAEPIVLIAGDYEDAYATYPDGHPSAGQRVQPAPKQEGLHFRVHSFNVFVKGRNPTEQGFNSFREITCSSGPEPHAPQPCIGCYQVDHGDKDAKSKDQWAFNIAHLGWYHMVPLVKDNQVQMKRDGSGPVMIKVECTTHKPESMLLARALPSGRVPPAVAKKAKQCDGCAQHAQFTWGDHRVLKLGFKHLKNLFEIDDKIGKKCLNCNTGILRVAFDCERCNTEMLDLSQVTWTNEQIDTFAKTPQQCQNNQCNHVGLPKSGYDCGYDENYNQIQASCGNSQKTTIFDCVLWVQREGESTESEVVVKRITPITQYVTQDNRPLQDYLKEIVKEPFNLTEMYKPDTLDEQAESIKVQNPYQQQQQYASYGGPPPGMNAGYPQPGQPQGYPVPGPPQPGYPQQGAPQQGYQQPGPQQPSYPNVPVPGRPNYGK